MLPLSDTFWDRDAALYAHDSGAGVESIVTAIEGEDPAVKRLTDSEHGLAGAQKVHPLVRDIKPPNTEPLPEARTQANSGGIYGRDASDERPRSPGATPSGRHTESARDGADLRTRRQVGD